MKDDLTTKDAENHLSGMPLMMADILRFVIEVIVHGMALFGAGCAFVSLWRMGPAWAKAAAFPAAWLGLAFGFYVGLILLRVLVVRPVPEGTWALRSAGARRWIVAQSYLMMVQRSPLSGLVLELAPQRYLFYRLLGARIHPTVLFGGGATLTDPWAVEIGEGATIGAESFTSSHVIEGDRLSVRRVRIGACATLGMRAIVLPGTTIGEGAIIGAGAVVRKDSDVPAGEIWAGVPARRIEARQGG